MSEQAAPDQRGVVAAEARAALAAGEATTAVGAWRRLVRAEPHVARWRLRLADALDAADDPVGAAEVRADVLEAFTRQRLLGTLVDTSPLFRDLSPGARAALLRGFEAREVPADTVLVEQGAPAGDLWLVVDGEVTVHRREGDDEAVQVATLGPGDVFGEIALLTGEPATATVRATRDGRLDVLGADAFAAVRAAHPEVAERLEALGADRVAENRFIFEDDAFFEDAD